MRKRFALLALIPALAVCAQTPAPSTIQVYWNNEHPACTVSNPGFKVGEQHTATFTASMPGQIGAVPVTFAVYFRHVNQASGGSQKLPDAIVIPFALELASPCPTITWK